MFCCLTTGSKQITEVADIDILRTKSPRIFPSIDVFFVRFLFLLSLAESRPHTGSVSTLVKAGPRTVPMSPTHLSLSRSEIAQRRIINLPFIIFTFGLSLHPGDQGRVKDKAETGSDEPGRGETLEDDMMTQILET